MFRGILLACAIACAGAAWAQDVTQTPDAAALEAADEKACALPTVPGKLMITMPKEPQLPACAAKNTCSKAAADSYNASITAFNKSMDRVNEATADYVAELNAFTRQASRYASCELQRVNAIIAE